jgi:hypothetical protein
MTDPDQANTRPTQDRGVTDASDPSPVPAPAPDTAAALSPAQADEPSTTNGTPDVMPGAGVRYAVLRLLMLVTVGGILYIIGMRGWALLFAAVLLSAIASWFVFMRQREAAARNLEAKLAERSARRQPESRSSTGSEDPAPAGSEG